MPTLIALTGPARSGKTTIARQLEARAFVRVRFAHVLKDMLRSFGLNEAQIDGDEKHEPCVLLCGKTPREAMQLLGDEWGRQLIGPDIWVRAAMRTVDGCLAGGRDVVIDDCRYANEALAVHKRGGYVVQLVREDAGIDGDHASERGVPQQLVDAFVSNNGKIEDAAAAVLRRIEEITTCRIN